MPVVCKKCGSYAPPEAMVCPKCGAYLLPQETRFVYEMKQREDVEGLIGALRHEDDDVRRLAAFCLGEIGYSKAVGPLIKLCGEDGFAPVRWTAATALGKIGDPRAVDALVRALQDRHSTVKQSAAEALGKIGDARAVDPLIRLHEQYETAPIGFAREYEEMRSSVLTALEKIDSPKAEKALKKLREKS